MSKIGQKSIKIPEKVEVNLGTTVHVKGPLGELNYRLPRGVKVKEEDGYLYVYRTSDERQIKAFHGLARSLIANMVEGVSTGFKKTLELSGIGYRANMGQGKLVLSLGFSHPVEVEPPDGVTFQVAENKISISGIDKELVGKVAADIRKIRKPDSYKGKGIRYLGEKLRLKPGKAAKAGGSK